MTKPIYALDFDGVICDSAIETAITGWRAAATIWPALQTASLQTRHIQAFRSIRPLLETGYEAILIMYALYKGEAVTTLCQHYTQRMAAIRQQHALDIDQLKQQFAAIRDAWIAQDEQDWLRHNPLFAGMQTRLQQLPVADIYIVTTKQERFARRILQAHDIQLPAAQVYGMDRQLGKQAVLQQLLTQHPERTMLFLEDRLPTLLQMAHNPALARVQRQLADWGYNTAADRALARQQGIRVISLADFGCMP